MAVPASVLALAAKKAAEHAAKVRAQNAMFPPMRSAPWTPPKIEAPKIAPVPWVEPWKPKIDPPIDRMPWVPTIQRMPWVPTIQRRPWVPTIQAEKIEIGKVTPRAPMMLGGITQPEIKKDMPLPIAAAIGVVKAVGPIVKGIKSLFGGKKRRKREAAAKQAAAAKTFSAPIIQPVQTSLRAEDNADKKVPLWAWIAGGSVAALATLILLFKSKRR